MRRRGSILIVVLFVMTILSMVAVSFAYRVGVTGRLDRQDAVMIRLRCHAHSAVAIAIAHLTENTNDFDHRAEPWCEHGLLASEDWLPEWGQDNQDISLRYVTDYHVIDEEAKLNLLYASSTALEKLGMSAEQIASLLDWIDTDDTARAEGAEDEYYASRSNPYRCKNGQLEMLDELLLIRGFGTSDYLGEDANHNGILDPCENDGTITYPPDDGDGGLTSGWVDLLTCLGDGGININTAPAAVLETIPISEEAIGQIIAYRDFDEGSSGDLVDHVFASSSDIDQLQGLSGSDREVLKAVAVFRSTHFRIFVRSREMSTDLEYCLQVVVRINGDSPEIVQWKIGA